MSNGNLKKILTDIADAIRAKEGSSDPINPQDFSTRISNLSGGGVELEGEYYLAKPNGRYWKSKLAIMLRNKYPVINTYELSDEQLEICFVYCNLFSYFGYSATYDYGGIPSHGDEVILTTPLKVAQRAGYEEKTLYDYKDGYYGSPNLMGSWRECSIDADIEGIKFEGGLVEFTRLILGAEDDTIYNMSDDEIITMLSEMFMLEQITKEEYESYYNW